MKKFIIGLLAVFIGVLSYNLETNASSSEYSIVKENKIYYLKIGNTKIPFDKIAKTYQLEVASNINTGIKEVIESSKDKIKLSNGKNTIFDKTEDKKETITVGGVEYNIKIDTAEKRGLINKLADDIKINVVKASYNNSIAVMNATSNGIVPINEFTHLDKDKYLINNQNADYSIDFLWSPVLGKTYGFSEKNLDEGNYTEMVKISSNNESSNLTIDKSIKGYLRGEGVEAKIYGKLPEDVDIGVDKYVLEFEGHKVESSLRGVLNYTYKVAYPYQFDFDFIGRDGYTLNKDNGFKVIEGILINISNNMVYKQKEESLEEIGDFSDLMLSRTDLSITKSQNNNLVVITGFQEAIYNSNKDRVVLTGRKINLGDLTSRFKFLYRDSTVLVTPKNGTPDNEIMRKFILSDKGSENRYKDSTNHVDLGSTPEYTKFESIFIDNQIVTEKGRVISCFVMLRNNSFINDTSLLTWLQSDKAKAIDYVDASLLAKDITGSIDFNDSKLTFEEFQNMQTIKNNLGLEKTNKIYSGIMIACYIISIFFFVYGMIMLMAFYIDVSNNIIPVKLLDIITFQKLSACSSRDDFMYSKSVSGEKKYITHKDIWIRLGICAIAGLIFLSTDKIISLIVRIMVAIKY